MLRQLKSDCRLHGGNFVVLPLAALFSGVIGTVLTWIMADGTETVWPCVGTVMSLLTVGMVGCIFVGAWFSSEFSVAVTMGCTRRQLALSFFVRALIMYALGYIVILLVHAAEVGLSKLAWPVHDWMPSIAHLLDPRWVLGLLLPLVLVPVCAALLVQRFGKPVTAILWILWVLCCILPSRLIDSGMLDWVTAVPAFVWWGLYAAVMLALGFTTVALLKRFAVR